MSKDTTQVKQAGITGTASPIGDTLKKDTIIASANAPDTCKKAPWMEIAWEEYKLWTDGGWKESTKLNADEQKKLDAELKPINDDISKNKTTISKNKATINTNGNEKSGKIKKINDQIKIEEKKPNKDLSKITNWKAEIAELNKNNEELKAKNTKLENENTKLENDAKEVKIKHGKGHSRASMYLKEGGDGGITDPLHKNGAWCSSFANWVILQTNKNKQTNFSIIKKEHNPNLATNWFDPEVRYPNRTVIKKTETPYYGAIAVLKVPNKGEGHAAFVINIFDKDILKDGTISKDEKLKQVEMQIKEKESEIAIVKINLSRDYSCSESKKELADLEKKKKQLEIERDNIKNSKKTSYPVKVPAKETHAYLLGGNQNDKICVQDFVLTKEKGKVKYETKSGKIFELLAYVCPKEYQLCEQHKKWCYEYVTAGYNVESVISTR